MQLKPLAFTRTFTKKVIMRSWGSFFCLDEVLPKIAYDIRRHAERSCRRRFIHHLPCIVARRSQSFGSKHDVDYRTFPQPDYLCISGRSLLSNVGPLSFRRLFIVSCLGGVCGAFLLLNTPATFFARLVPWLVLFATSIFAWGSFRRKKLHVAHTVHPTVLIGIQACIAVYGGYFGGGIGFLMLAALTVAGLPVRTATANKNILAMAMNASAVLIFVFSKLVNWPAVIALGLGGIAGGLAGSWLMHRVSEKLLRGFVVVVGILLTIWLFIR
jgi:uncharacterized protein